MTPRALVRLAAAALILLTSPSPTSAAVPAEDAAAALRYAARAGGVEVAALLLRSGADPRLATRAGATPFRVAAESGHSDLASRLALDQAPANASPSAAR